MFEKLVAPIAFLGSHLKEVAGLHGPLEFTLEDFRLELARLGLLGRAFAPDEYRAALEEDLGIEILVEEVPDVGRGPLTSEVVAKGNLAEVVYGEKEERAIVLVRKSLRYRPWPAYELGIYHELSHLAAGHPVQVGRARGRGEKGVFRSLRSRLALREPATPRSPEELEDLVEKVFEPEARRRAKWLVLAGTCPKILDEEKADRFT